MGLFQAECPVAARERQWIEESMTWFRAEFGPGYLRRPIILPTNEFFPGPHDGSIEAIRATVGRLCEYTDVDPAAITVELYGDSAEKDLARAAGLTLSSHGAAGHYRKVDGRAVIGIDKTLGANPVRLVATVAHELGHVRLLGEGRITADRADHEPLTDLLTIYLSLGIFTANARFDYRQDNARRSTSNLGYLTEPMFGYGLACHAWLRGEPHPDWLSHVDTNPRTYAKRGLRHGGPMTVGQIVERVPVGQSTVSAHLKVLADVRFVPVDRRGTASFYRVNRRCVSRFPSAADVVMGKAPATVEAVCS